MNNFWDELKDERVESNSNTQTFRDNLTAQGEIGEMMVTMDLTRKGFIVSTPETASSPYDKIVDIDSILKKIQVKSIKLSSTGIIIVPLVNRKNSSVAKNGRGQTHSYVKLVDYIAVWIKNTDEIYYIPTEDLPKDKSVAGFTTKYHTGNSKYPLITKYENL